MHIALTSAGRGVQAVQARPEGGVQVPAQVRADAVPVQDLQQRRLSLRVAVRMRYVDPAKTLPGLGVRLGDDGQRVMSIYYQRRGAVGPAQVGGRYGTCQQQQYVLQM